MSETAKGKKIRALIGLTKMTDSAVKSMLDAALNGLRDNATAFPKPPVELPAYQAAIEAYHASIPAALDGSKTAIAQKTKLRDAAIKLYVQLAHYVEANCNDNVATFLSSGFQPVNTIKSGPQPLAQPAVSTVLQGPNSGQLKVRIGAVPRARSYELRYAAVPGAGGTPGSWAQQAIATTKPTIIGGLTPGIVYAFQVRALGRLGHTDWSDAVTRMVI
jgi:hypothetical protein